MSAPVSTTVTMDYGSLFGTVVTEALKGVTQVLPLGLTILGVYMAIGFGTKLMRKFAK